MSTTQLSEQLHRRAAPLKRRIALPEATDPRVAGAITRLVRDGLVHPVAVGSPREIEAALAAAGAPGGVECLDPVEGAEWATAALFDARGDRISEAEAQTAASTPLTHALLALRTGRVDGCVAGAVHTTSEVLRGALHLIGPAPGTRTISSAFYMSLVPPGAKDEVTLTFTDCAVVPEPSVDQLAEIAIEAVRARRKIVGDEPRVAFLSYATRGSAAGASVARVRAALERFRERMPGVAADGEMQADAALVPDVARRKASDSPLEGRANLLVFPNLDAANIAYKLVERLAGARAVGPVLQGLALPVNDLSRGAREPEVVDAACVAALLSGG
ncbi:MAG: phosphate acyltransferase [Longimicrobiales bacterium]|nr:phosphate acyltransferase [Longimicrobiales bacterium]